MRVLISKSEIKGAVQAPPSKSYTIRGLMCAALARGQSEILHPLDSDDTQAASRVLGQIGVKITQKGDIWRVNGDNFKAPVNDLFCGDSAATLRFMSAICALVPGRCKLTAGVSLSRRPVRTEVDALKMLGIDISCNGEFAPVAVNGGKFRGGQTELPGDISSQYVSALLFIAPLAEENTRIRLTSPLDSRPYVLMTLECLRRFGINIGYSAGLTEYEIFPQSYKPDEYKVEGDWSSASYLLGLGAVGGKLEVGNLDIQSLQGDKAIEDLLAGMGVPIVKGKDSVSVIKTSLRSIKADLNDCIDLLPTMAVLAALAEGTSEFTGIERARLKESNRVSSLREGLERAGIGITEEKDRIRIAGGRPSPAIIDSKNDHRIAMAFSLMGVAAGGVTIEGAECVSKTYPEYWNILRQLGVKLDEQ
jgi:3-phosphoshikimate 1-carboxyvinyltransferase